MSYIVKKCPAYDKQYNECHSKIEPHRIYCQDCNCVIKQVIEKCKVVYNTERLNRYKTNGFILANDILQLFDIEE